MDYQIGDTVIHWTHGLGKVIGIDEKNMAGAIQQYYVVEVEFLKLWVPVGEAMGGAIRLPAESAQFMRLFDILRMPGNKLPDQKYQRKLELRERMQKRTLESLCHVIRDLSDLSRQHALNPDDAAVLYRAEEHLLDEWVLSLGTDRSEALSELERMLRGGQSND